MPAKELLKILPKTDIPGCEAFLVIDEISLLNDFDPNLLLALRRALRLLRQLPIWTFFLDTSSGLAILAPASDADGSSRVVHNNLQRVKPFFALSIDIEFHRRFLDPNLRREELRKSLSDFGTIAHMSLFGRPLWAVYEKLNDNHFLSAVQMKLLGGCTTFDPKSKHHVFALLASRICLAPCFRNTAANELSKVAVSFHLRLISSIDIKRGRTLTVTPSEPLVSEAAAHCLHGNWPTVIRVLTDDLLGPGLLDPGLGGELFARILFIMAKDATAEDADAKNAACNIASGQRYSAPVKLCDFLTKMFGRLLDNLPSTFTTAFKDARVNFNHFVTTDKQLDRKHCDIEMLYKLLYTNAALQLVVNQADWDLLIPVYLGNPSEPFDTAGITSILVQIKNRVGRVAPFEVNPINYDMVRNGKNPILFLQLEFGVTRTGIDHKFDRDIYAIRIKGKNHDTYSFLTDKVETALHCMLTELTPCVDGTQKEKDQVEQYARLHYSGWKTIKQARKGQHEEVDELTEMQVCEKRRKGSRS